MSSQAIPADLPTSPRASSHEAQEHSAPRLSPIDRPKSLLLRLVFWQAKRRYGKVPTAFRVVYSRAPALLLATLALITVAERLLRVPARIRALLQFAIASEHGCTFCADLTLAEAMRAKVGVERFQHLNEFETHSAFDEQERAVIAYAKALAQDRNVPEDVFDRLRDGFDEREVIEIVWLGGFESYFNAMAVPLSIGSDHLAAGQRQPC